MAGFRMRFRMGIPKVVGTLKVHNENCQYLLSRADRLEFQIILEYVKRKSRSDRDAIPLSLCSFRGVQHGGAVSLRRLNFLTSWRN